jgi:hypothetical protein
MAKSLSDIAASTVAYVIGGLWILMFVGMSVALALGGVYAAYSAIAGLPNIVQVLGAYAILVVLVGGAAHSADLFRKPGRAAALQMVRYRMGRSDIDDERALSVRPGKLTRTESAEIEDEAVEARQRRFVGSYVLMLLTILTASTAYYIVVVIPARDRAHLEFEQEKFRAEQKRQESQAEQDQRAKDEERKRSDAEEQRRGRILETCEAEAERAYWAYVRVNGTRDSNSNSGAYFASQDVWDTAESEKQRQLESCYRRNGLK